ncbi:barstar family protein [Actinokineospora sp. G85]|uniref:barstar family protein n=1 Tax=Actinokineospora sp. G85 TaxID=3406626 RepID=UPI003C767956
MSAHEHRVDGSALRSKRATLDAIAEALDFPAYSGRNLDALFDCLVDLSWLPEGEHVLVWSGSDALAAADPRAHRGIRSVLEDATERTTGTERPFRFTT